VLEAKVNRYLKQSLVLETFWGMPITSDLLREEMERQALQTRMPDRLRELYLALGNDSVLIQESLVRPALVDRLMTSLFNFDPVIHQDAKQSAESLRLRLLEGQVDPYQNRRDRTVVDLVRMDPGQGGDSETQRKQNGNVHELTAAEFDAWRGRVTRVVGGVGPVEEELGAFVIRVLLEERPNKIRVATFLVAKKNFEDWSKTMDSIFDVSSVKLVASAAPLPRVGSSTSSSSSILTRGSVPQGDGHHPLEAVLARFGHSAIWTGSEMIVWGGSPSGQGATGARYDPATDTWVTTTTSGAPSPREYHTAVWTGNEMIVWGGQDQFGQHLVNTGGKYNPAIDTWTPTTTTGAPQGRWFHAAFWTGKFMVVWGGGAARELNNGGRYDPIRDKWLRIRTGSAPRGGGNSVVWTGKEMIVWGGEYGRGHSTYLDTGGRYNPDTNTWVPTSTIGAATPRSQHTAVWTGTEMIVWGGSRDTSGGPGSGGRYDPATDTWTGATSDVGAPDARVEHHAVWTGSVMIVWGGIPFLNTGGRYDPLSDTWAPTSTLGAPAGKDGQSAIWCGTAFIVWGGNFTNTGGRYDPVTDTWTPTGTEIRNGATE
jgi:hypothetical protein